MWETTRPASDTESAYAIELNGCEGCPVVVAGVTGAARDTGWVDVLDPVTGGLSPFATVSGFAVLDIAPGNDGLVIGGSTPANDWVVATISMAGTELWRTSITQGDRLRGVATDRNGYIHAVGNAPGTDALIALLSPAGVLLGTQVYDRGVSEELNSIAIGPEGLVTAAGQSRDPAINNNTFLLLNFDTGKSFLLGPVP
jgi:hypothetical protein